MRAPWRDHVYDPGMQEAETESDALQVLDKFFDEYLGGYLDSPALQALTVFVVSLVVAKVTDSLLCGVIRRWARRTRFELDDQIVELLHAPLFRSVVILGLWIAANRLDFESEVQETTGHALLTILLLIWTVFSFRFVHLLMRSASRMQDRFHSIEARTFPLFDNLGKVLVAGFAVYLFIILWGISPTGWFASAGVVGIALGFAAKDSLANLISGVFIIADAPYRVGDFIVLEDDTRGRVVHIGLRSTRIITRDDIEITVPNSILGTTRVTNETGGGHTRRRIRIKVGVAYGSDIDRVRKVLMEVAAADEKSCEEPEPRVRFRQFGESSLDFELLCWIPEPVLRGQIIDSLNCAVYKRFAEAGIEIAFPQRDVYIREMPGKKEKLDAS